MIKLWTVVAAAAMGLTACQGNFDEQVGANVKNSVTVKFVAEEARTAVDTSGDTPLFSWDDDETFVVLEQTDDLAESTSVSYAKVDGKATITAEFDENAGKDEYKYIAIYPESNYGYGDTKSINEATLILPEEQYMYSESSYDPNADLMVSWPVTTSAQPTEAQQLRFTRLAAVAEMSINNLTLAAGEEVESVEFTANGKALAGTITANLEDPHAFTVKEGVSTVSVAHAPANKVYFTVLPTTLNAGDAYSVVVVTNKSIYIKQGVVAEGKSLAFEAGKVTRFGVNMTDALVGAKWKLVRYEFDLKQGDVVTIVAKNYNYVIGKPSSSVYPLASQTEVVKAGNYIYHKPANDSADHMMQTYTLMKRDANLTLFDFYNGVDFEGDTNVGFAQATGSNNTPKLQAYCDDSTLFDVSIADGVASVTASKISGSYKYWRYYHSTYAASRKFDLTSSQITSDANKIHLYRLEGAVGTIPTIAANVTVPAATKPVVIAEEGVAEATAIEEVVFNYVGDWKIAVSDNAEWLNVAYDAAKNALTYTAEANVNPKRDAVVTITASLEGQESLTWTFNMLQKGAPVEISIADFGKLSKDENAVYKLTGKVTALATNNSSAYVLSDENGNVANIKYLDTEDGEDVWGHDDFTIKLGDVMTVTTVPQGSKNGGSSSYPSIYKGHYRLAVSAGVAADYTGGSVAIEVATSSNGGVTVPTAVEGAMEECDYATFSYDGGDTATISFTSENTTSYARKVTATFTYGLASASVTVQQGVNPANKIGWELVTDASTLAVGDEVIIVAKNADKALAKPTSTSQANFPAAEIEKVGNLIYDIEDTNTQTFTLGQGVSEGTLSFDFTYNNTGYRLYYSTNLKMRATSNAVNAATSWAITINEADGDASILSTKLIKFNGATGTTFSMQSTTATNASKPEFAVCIYKKQVK